MLFPTFLFALFFLPVLLISWRIHDRHVTNKVFLTAASYAFYAAWDWRFCGLLFLSSCTNHGLARAVHDRPGRAGGWIVSLGVAANLATLGYFKYWGFFATQADSLLASAGLPSLVPLIDVVLPVGVSFFTFHGISYLVDVRRGLIPPARSLLDVLLYVSFFPHLVAGPIVRASYFLPQLERPTDPRDVRLTAALALVVGGLIKKVLLADVLATDLADPAFLDPSSHGSLDLWAGMYAYAAQIFCDFSAYTDIATGVAAMFGFRFPANFNQPYRSTSPSDFWTRWHISLSSWLRDYLYIPLGGNRHGKIRTCFNLGATMLLGGLWHGANWTFVVWGALHGAALVAARVVPIRMPSWLAWFLNFHLVCLAWIPFRSPDLATAWAYFQGLFSAPGQFTGTGLAVAAALVTLVMQFASPGWFGRACGAFSRMHWAAQGALAGIAVPLIAALGPDGIPPFIYFAF
jgi:D-alanyl-lipoteichoic acid acyltransferase DltB (MBOAT superfamily)